MTITEVVARLSSDEVAVLRGHYTSPVSDVVRVSLARLLKSNQVFTPGRTGFRRQWGIPGLVRAPTAVLLDAGTPSELVLDLVHAAIERVDRPVRLVDILEQASIPPASVLTRKSIGRTLAWLLQSGKLVVHEFLGHRRDGGRNTYVPAGFDVSACKGRHETTDRDLVLSAVREIWARHIAQVENERQDPTPVSTTEIRDQVDAALQPQVLRILRSSSRGPRSALVAVYIQTGGGTYWVPREQWQREPSVAPDTTRLPPNAPGTRRAAAALWRACERSGLPLASTLEIRREAQADPALRPPGVTGMGRALESASRAILHHHGRSHLRRSAPPVVHVGLVRNIAHYSLPSRLSAARVHITILQAEEGLRAERVMEQSEELEGCALKRVVRLRAAELISTINAAADTLQVALTEPDAEESTREAAAELVSELSALRRRLEGLDPLVEVGQGGVPVEVATWTREELYDVASRLRPGRMVDQGAEYTTRLLGRTIRRLPNPEFVARSRRDPVQSRQWHFDRTAALLRLAQEHGGNECILQSMIARRELGTFRNWHVIVAALESGSLDERLAAAASLAFLWSQDGTAALRRAALGDTAPGVRQVALWGFGFANGDDALDLARRQGSADVAPEVRSFAQAIADTVAENERGWWAV